MAKSAMTDITIPSQVAVICSFLWNLLQVYEYVRARWSPPENKTFFNGDMALLIEQIYERAREQAIALDDVIDRLKTLDRRHQARTRRAARDQTIVDVA